MAKSSTVTVTTTCDACNKSLETQEAAIVIGRKSYELDLCEKDFTKLSDLAAKSGRVSTVGAKAKRSGRHSNGKASNAEEMAAIREWARGQGYEVSNRGRIPAEIREAYANAN